MQLKQELIQDLETTLQNFHNLLDTVPEALYVHPSINPVWTIGDVLYHITLGPPAIRFEIGLIKRAPWIINTLLNDSTSRVFNWANAIFARQPKRIGRQSLIKAYEAGHAGLMSALSRLDESDLGRSAKFPAAFVAELAGVVTIERMYRYITEHFEAHAAEIRAALEAPK